MQQQPYIVYIKADDYGRITAINSSAFLHDTTDWIKIDEGFEDKHHHAQGNYLDLPLYDEQGCHNWYLVDSKPVLATQEQKDAELAARPAPEPTPMETLQKENNLLKAQVNALATNQEFLEDCLIEVGQVVYAE